MGICKVVHKASRSSCEKNIFFVRTGAQRAKGFLHTHLKLKELPINKSSGALNTSYFPLELFGCALARVFEDDDPVKQEFQVTEG